MSDNDRFTTTAEQWASLGNPGASTRMSPTEWQTRLDEIAARNGENSVRWEIEER